MSHEVVRVVFSFVLRNFSWTGRVMEKVRYFSKFVDSFVKLGGQKALMQGKTLPPRGRGCGKARKLGSSIETKSEAQSPGKARGKGAKLLRAHLS